MIATRIARTIVMRMEAASCATNVRLAKMHVAVAKSASLMAAVSNIVEHGN